MSTLLVEIGAEELPAGYIIPALKSFKKSMLSALSHSRINHGNTKIFGTPRRLALMIFDVASQQEAQKSKVTGPPEKIGFDEGGNPTTAALKFAEKAGISIDKVIIEETNKGRYLTAVVDEECETSAVILERILEKQILSIPFPKRMRWGSLSIHFARPIISLTALLGNQVLDFKVGNISSSDFLYGHQFMCPGEFKIESADNYVEVAESAGVIPDIEKRKTMLRQSIEKYAGENDAKILEDEALINIVTNLVEYPFPAVGNFDDDFLQVPDEVLITAMREHQKYFALVDQNNQLKPLFIAVNNTKAKDMQRVVSGHEKVLRARLSDAKFFYDGDIKSTLDEFARKLKFVTFQEKLGSVYDKSVRIGKLGKFLVEASAYKNKSDLSKNVERAASICKADLVSQVVIEFTKLQGIIGRVYASRSGENQDVFTAIEQHYRPVYSGGELPENPTASLLAIADKLDTICGCFSVDLMPTGGADPYALRRQGIGILQIMLEEKIEISLRSMIQKGLSAFIENKATQDETLSRIFDFLKKRMMNMLAEMGFSKEAVNAAIGASFENVPDLALRVKSLDSLRKDPNFEPLSITFKRVENILKKSESDLAVSVDESLFEDASEHDLFNTAQNMKNDVEDAINKDNYDQALSHIAGLKDKVDAFFDDVMVMAEDVKIRQNRIAVLSMVSVLFKHIRIFQEC